MKGISNWVGKYVNSKYGPYLLGFLVFIEGFLPIPSSTILAFYCLQNRRKSLIYAFITTIMSVFAAFIGYIIGSMFWDTLGQRLVNALMTRESFEYITGLYRKYQAATIFVTSLTPIPFKFLTLTAGFCKLPVLKFLTYTLIARGIRFYAIATSIYLWGDKVNSLLNKYFYYIIIVGLILLILIWAIFR